MCNKKWIILRYMPVEQLWQDYLIFDDPSFCLETYYKLSDELCSHEFQICEVIYG